MRAETFSSAARWLARRALYEAGVEPALIATASGISLATLLERAKADGWIAPAQRSGRSAAARLADVASRLVGEVETIERGVHEGAVDKVRIEAVMSLLKLVEKLGELTPDRDEQDEGQARTDVEIAAVLASIDAAIIAHATFVADRRPGAAARA